MRGGGGKDPLAQTRIMEKIEKVRRKGYLISGNINILVHCFGIPKVGNNIILVYDVTKSGVNNVIWSPNFFLPPIISIAQSIIATIWMPDIDLEDIFPNFPLDRSIIPYVGIDVT